MSEMKAIEAAVEAELAYRARRHMHVIAGGLEYVHPMASAVEVAAKGSIPEGAEIHVCASAACLS